MKDENGAQKAHIGTAGAPSRARSAHASAAERMPPMPGMATLFPSTAIESVPLFDADGVLILPRLMYTTCVIQKDIQVLRMRT